MERLQRLVLQVNPRAQEAAAFSPLASCPTKATFTDGPKSDDDVVICAALRTAVAKAKRGGFKDTTPDDLLAPLFKAIVERTKVPPKEIGDVIIGNVLMPGAAAVPARLAQLLGGLPVDVPIATINRQCSSGLQAVANIAASIRSGIIDVGIAGGVESMSLYSMGGGITPDSLSSSLVNNQDAMNCLLPMGITSENVAAKYGIPRAKQDSLAVASHAKALAAQKAGFFKDEILPVKTKVKDAKGNVKEVVVDKDEGPREGVTLEGLAALHPAFKADGSTTAGNASQVSDGAALVLLARRSAAQRLGLPVLARFRSFASVGVDPALMGIGPAFAIPAALEKAGLTIGDIDIFEINEAFASQAVMSIEHLKIPLEKVNPKGGAIAIGHPLGCTGSRQIATLLPELKRTNKKLGVISMCIGTGMGAAAVIESEQ